MEKMFGINITYKMVSNLNGKGIKMGKCLNPKCNKETNSKHHEAYCMECSLRHQAKEGGYELDKIHTDTNTLYVMKRV